MYFGLSVKAGLLNTLTYEIPGILHVRQIVSS